MNTIEKPNSSISDNPYLIIAEPLQKNQIFIPGDNSCIRIIFIVYALIGFSPVIGGIIIMINGGPEIGLPIFLAFLFPIVPIIMSFKKNLEIQKDILNKTITVYDKNICCCVKKYNFSLDHIQIKYNFRSSKIICNSENTCRAVIILNVNPNEIDLDKGYIRNSPFKFYNQFNCGTISNELQSNLDNFTDLKFENKIKEELKEYEPNFEKNLRSHFILVDNDITYYIIKVSEYLYIYYTYNYYYNCITEEKFERLDWAYSNNFDRIFLGVVKNSSSYKITFTYNINTIDKFCIESKDECYFFKVVLNSGVNENICKFTKKQEKNLNHFLYLINGQINKINKKIIDNCPPTIK